MNLAELKAAAKEAEYGKSDMHIHPATILRLIAVCEAAERTIRKLGIDDDDHPLVTALKELEK